MQKVIIAAVSQNFVIGRNGKIPWYSKEELNHFVETTKGFPVLMGRKTWESIGKPLKDRINIIITHNKFYNQKVPQLLVFTSLSEAFDYCKKNYKKIFIIGGESIFNQTISTADEILLSVMRFNIEGDAFFPKIDLNIWELYQFKEFNDFTFYHYLKKVNK
ncbi:MAG: dihydrofolate reductase [Melioribacter sp.]|nr:dihydrofolate reductase [Melioribacter sp.]